ncbi:MAG: hypothetical protein NVS1B2_15890 [Vulcanimicrobiaceae bacterium]
MAHIRADAEKRYGERLVDVTVSLVHQISYQPTDFFAKFKNAGDEPAEPEAPHAIYQLVAAMTCRSKTLRADRVITTTMVVAATPERLFEKFVTECESEESQALCFPKSHL